MTEILTVEQVAHELQVTTKTVYQWTIGSEQSTLYSVSIENGLRLVRMREMQKIHPLRAIREAHNLTREQLAREIGVGHATIKRAERWEPIGPESRRRLCVFFGQM